MASRADGDAVQQPVQPLRPTLDLHHHAGRRTHNNRAEQSLCHARAPRLRGRWRKLSFGTPNAQGSRFVETLLTVVETCRQQKRNILDFLTASIQAHLNANPAPKLIAGV